MESLNELSFAAGALKTRPEIITAAATGREEEVERMLVLGGSANVKTVRGTSALMAAVIGGHVKCAKMLIDAGADINEITRDGISIASAAAICGREEIFRLLTSAEAEVTDPKGILLNAVINGKPVIAAIAAGIAEETDFTNPEGYTPLLIACSQEDFSCALVLLNAGADANCAGANGYTPLIMAAFKGNEQIVKLLLEHGADKSKRGPSGIIALNVASNDAVKKLLS